MLQNVPQDELEGGPAKERWKRTEWAGTSGRAHHWRKVLGERTVSFTEHSISCHLQDFWVVVFLVWGFLLQFFSLQRKKTPMRFLPSLCHWICPCLKRVEVICVIRVSAIQPATELCFIDLKQLFQRWQSTILLIRLEWSGYLMSDYEILLTKYLPKPSVKQYSLQ